MPQECLDVGALYGLLGSLLCRSCLSALLARRSVSLHVPEQNVGYLEGRHGEVNVLGHEECGDRRPAPGVADVVEGNFDGVHRGCRALS